LCARSGAVADFSGYQEGEQWKRDQECGEPSRLPLFPRERCNIEKRKNKRSRQRCTETNTLRKAGKAMETNADGTYFQEGDRVRLKRTGETGRINATDGGVVYVLMDDSGETKLFSAYVDEDPYIELFTPESEEARR